MHDKESLEREIHALGLEDNYYIIEKKSRSLGRQEGGTWYREARKRIKFSSFRKRGMFFLIFSISWPWSSLYLYLFLPSCFDMGLIIVWCGSIGYIDCWYSLIGWLLKMIDCLCLKSISHIVFLIFSFTCLSLFDITWDKTLHHLVSLLCVDLRESFPSKSPHAVNNPKESFPSKSPKKLNVLPTLERVLSISKFPKKKIQCFQCHAAHIFPNLPSFLPYPLFIW